MITRYQVRTMENDEEVLILWISLKTEFSNEWFSKMKNSTYKEFIKNHNIIWNGTKVFLVVGGVVLAVLNYHGTSPNNNYNYNYIPERLNNNFTINELVDNEKVSVTEDENEKEILSEDIQEEALQETKEEIKKEPNKEEAKKPPISTNANQGSSTTNNKDDVVASPSTNEENLPKEEVNNQEIEKTETVTVYRNDGQIINLSIDDYLIGVVAAEMPASFNIEALKAQSILARTYLRKSQSIGKKLTDTVDTQRYIDTGEMKRVWGNSYNTYYSKIETAVKETEDLVITYHGNLIDAVYHSTSNGKTENSSYVWGNSYPYLQTVSSTWDINASSYFRSVEIEKQKFLNIFGLSDDSYYVEILSRNSSGRVEFIKVGDKVYTGVDVRTKLGLRSTDFDIYLKDNIIQVDTRGYGHGVGLSQYGANGMAKEGYNYLQIIKHYYNGVDITSLL